MEEPAVVVAVYSASSFITIQKKTDAVVYVAAAVSFVRRWSKLS